MFSECINLKEIKGLNNFNTESADNMKEMFNGCKSLLNLDIPNFKTNIVHDMSAMFKDCSSLKRLNINQFEINDHCVTSDIFKGINKINCELITENDNIRNLFDG